MYKMLYKMVYKMLYKMLYEMQLNKITSTYVYVYVIQDCVEALLSNTFDDFKTMELNH